MDENDQVPLGPAMMALRPRERGYVIAMAADPFGTPSAWAAAAGYPVRKNGNHRRQGHRLAHSSKVEAAILEYSRGMMATVGPVLAAAVLIRTARDGKSKRQLQAAEMIANRVGLHEVQEVKVQHRHTIDATELEALARRLALENGIDPRKFLGFNTAPVIEGEVVDAKATDT